MSTILDHDPSLFIKRVYLPSIFTSIFTIYSSCKTHLLSSEKAQTRSVTTSLFLTNDGASKMRSRKDKKKYRISSIFPRSILSLLFLFLLLRVIFLCSSFVSRFPRSFVPRNKQDKTIFEIKRSKLLRFSSRILRQLFHILPPRKDRLFR